ncbi:MAG TPA: CsbD family protein [Lacipirellulaceae bacterium]
MTTQEQIFGHWNQLKGKIKESWGQITDDDLLDLEGKFDQLVGLIQDKTGEGRQKVERALHELGESAAEASDGMRGYVEDVGETVSAAVEHTRELAEESYEQAQELMRRRPAEAVAVAFGTGLLMGVVVGLAVRSR